MNKKTKEFEKIMRKIIRAVIAGESLTEFCKTDSEQVCECIERQYIGGITYGRSMTGEAHFNLQKPFVRYKGIEFLENKHPNLKSNVTFVFSICSIILSALSVTVSFLAQYIDISNVLHQLF